MIWRLKRRKISESGNLATGSDATSGMHWTDEVSASYMKDNNYWLQFYCFSTSSTFYNTIKAIKIRYEVITL